MPFAPSLSAQLGEVWGQLDLVMDPELDEPITDMGFVEAVSVTGPATVDVAFRLPTYWCSPNFAFLMATGIRRTVEALPWVARCVVRLEDHNSGAELNAAVNSGGSFADVFPDLPDGEDLHALREKFEAKAFQRRQEVVIKALKAQGFSNEAIVALTLRELDAVVFDDAGDSRQKRRYRDLLVARGIAARPDDPAMTTPGGAALVAAEFAAYLGLLRSVRINMEFNGALCRGLKDSRYQEAGGSAGPPVLTDLLGRAEAARSDPRR